MSSVEADVLCLQEVTRVDASVGWVEYRDGHNDSRQRSDLHGDLTRALSGHRDLFVAHDAGPVTTATGSHRQEFGLATWVRDDVDLVDHRHEFVNGAFTVHDAWPHSDRPRAAQGVRVRSPRLGTVAVVQVHGLRDAAGKGDTPARASQARRLARFVETLAHGCDQVVVAGDLNVLPDSETLAVLRATGLTDLVGTTPTRTSHYRKPVRHADYVLVADPWAVRSFEVVEEPEVSDHRPLVLDP